MDDLLFPYQSPSLPDTPENEVLSKILKSENCRSHGDLQVILGENKHLSLLNFPNILVAGTIGSGKTQFIYTQIASFLLCKQPSEVKFIMCGGKSVDYYFLHGLRRHFLITREPSTAVIANKNDFLEILKALAVESEKRLELFRKEQINGFSDFIKRNLTTSNNKEFDSLPQIILFIDDLSDFVNDEITVALLSEFTQKNRNTGLYIIAVTSQINSKFISNKLKANFTGRISFKLMSPNDSRKILGVEGAEKLKNPGELFSDSFGKEAIIHPYIDYYSLEFLINEIDRQPSSATTILAGTNPIGNFDPNDRDPLFEDAARLIVMHQQGSTSLIQRKLKLGYNRSGRLIDQLEAAGIVGQFEGSAAREVLIPDDYALEQFLENLQDGKIQLITKITDVQAQPVVQEHSNALVKKKVSPQKKDLRVDTKKEEVIPVEVKKAGFWESLFSRFFK